MWNKFIAWCGSDTATARCTRTIFQAIIGVIINFLPDLIAGTTVIPYEMKPFVQAFVMAVLSPIQKALGDSAVEKE